ncbi:MAG: lycopene cyclase domain-containing protein [candidate division KSB1 bacterium]|nr:lycopene cyclase domain-containing protein [candidate division KSB1 bacterium]MDZ7345818.1 lycopene cyclase domain-containing protein [candidate division KSB1 bacterium]
MRSEYLLFNLFVFIGPLLNSFDHKVRFFKQWPKAFIAVFLSLIPFIIWDIAVTGRHWYFNKRFILGPRLLGLPVEEWSFFVTVPFACLFIWEIIIKFLPHKKLTLGLGLPAGISGLAGIMLFFQGREYTGLVLIAAATVYFLNAVIKTKIWEDSRIWVIIGAVLILTLIFNTYLTARPIVLYNSQYMLGTRIFTIPVEDFIFGLSHILLTVTIYERLKGNFYEKDRSDRRRSGRTGRRNLAGTSESAGHSV